MAEGPTVSVIVPVFNGARYIDGCIGFLKAQTFGDFETILCVDVNSTDGSLEKAGEAAASLPNCRVVEQTDGMHLAGARNIGIRNASGRFVWFCDVDDAPSPELLEECLRIQKETSACMVCFNAMNVGPHGVVKERRRKKYQTVTMTRDEALVSWFPMKVPVTAWSKLVSRDLLTADGGLFFRDTMAEDISFTYEAISRCDRIAVYLRPLYAYRMTCGSITRSSENMDRRGRDEIAAYGGVDVMEMGSEIRGKVLCNNAYIKMRSSGHMSREAFLEFAKSDEFGDLYERYLKGHFEGWGFYHFPRVYYSGIRFYLKHIYKRNGSTYMRTKI